MEGLYCFVHRRIYPSPAIPLLGCASLQLRMHAELSVISFLCVTLLLALLPLHWKSHNVSIIALIVWLVACNTLQGVNSVLWRNDSLARAVVWCDIVTKIRLGAQLSLPASGVCICWHFYCISSNTDGKRRNHRMTMESLLCILLPLIYMALHVIVQDNRFDLTQDFGCTSSTYTSIPALILVWIPPLILCSIIYVFTALALWSHFRVERSRFSTSMITLTFVRPLLTSIIIASIILFATIFTIYTRLFSVGGFLPWKSISDTHATISVVNVISHSSRTNIARVAVEWWAIPAISLLFIIQTFFGLIYGPRSDESMTGLRTVGRWVNHRVLRKSVGMESFITSSPSITLKSPPTPVHLLKSGWDDTLRSNNSQAKVKTRPVPPPIICDILPPSPVPSSSETEGDNPFGVSTLTYLPSPPGPLTLELPPRAKVKSVKTSHSPPSQSPHRLSVPAIQEHISESPASVADSILSGSWPEPPSSIPLSSYSPTTVSIPSPVSAYSRASSRAIRHASTSSLSGSMASSTVSMHGYAVYDPALPPPTPHRAPFEDAAAPEEILHTPSHKQRGLRKKGSRDTFSGRALSRKTRDRPSRNGSDTEGIYMTVVQETV